MKAQCLLGISLRAARVTFESAHASGNVTTQTETDGLIGDVPEVARRDVPAPADVGTR